jgi:putative Holliday junction resolvase
MRTLGIDLGARRVGLALSDADGRLASPLEVLQVSSADGALDPVMRVILEEGVERVVVGLPLNMDDSIGPQARQAIAWAKTLRRRSGKPVLLVDERLSTYEAEQTLIERKRGGEKLTRKRKKERLDAVAAAVLLQAFLDGRSPAIDCDERGE